KTPKDLDFCEYAESGRGTAWCASLEVERHSFLAERRIGAVRTSLDAAARQSLAQLEKAADAFKEGGCGAPGSRRARRHDPHDHLPGRREGRGRALCFCGGGFRAAKAPAASPAALTAQRTEELRKLDVEQP